MSHLSPDEFLHPSVQEAIHALERVGADPEPRFALTVEHPILGKVKRVFGILGNVVDKKGYVEDHCVVDRLLHMVKDVDNERIYERLKSGKLKYTPVNKRAMRHIAKDLLKTGVHLPWTWRPMNFDFAAHASTIHRQSPLPFLIFYSQQSNFTEDGVSLSRIFSLPIEGHAQGTWAEPISDDMLDLDVVMVLEANARA